MTIKQPARPRLGLGLAATLRGAEAALEKARTGLCALDWLVCAANERNRATLIVCDHAQLGACEIRRSPRAVSTVFNETRSLKRTLVFATPSELRAGFSLHAIGALFGE